MGKSECRNRDSVSERKSAAMKAETLMGYVAHRQAESARSYRVELVLDSSRLWLCISAWLDHGARLRGLSTMGTAATLSPALADTCQPQLSPDFSNATSKGDVSSKRAALRRVSDDQTVWSSVSALHSTPEIPRCAARRPILTRERALLEASAEVAC
jgi:hypothetical protein